MTKPFKTLLRNERTDLHVYENWHVVMRTGLLHCVHKRCLYYDIGLFYGKVNIGRAYMRMRGRGAEVGTVKASKRSWNQCER